MRVSPDYDEDYGMAYDEVIDTHDVLLIQAAGNQTTCPRERYSLTWGSDSYNAIVVGASSGDAVDMRAKNVVIVSSGRGPTPLKRKKPDVVAPGTDNYND